MVNCEYSVRADVIFPYSINIAHFQLIKMLPLASEFESAAYFVNCTYVHARNCTTETQVVGTRCARIKSSEDAALHSVHKSSSVSSSNELGGPTAVFHGKKRCLLAEQQTSHKRNKAEHSQGENNDIYNEISQTVVADTESSCNGIPSTRRALVGVKLMWVSPTHRRQRVARTLLDTVRQCFVFGTVVSVADLVFSQPTQDGFAFASSYCQSDTVNAYA